VNRWQDVLELDVQVAIYAGNGALWDTGKWDTGKWVGAATGDGLWWTSIYDRVTGLSVSRGRSDLMGDADTGTAQIDVINDDGWASGLPSSAGMAPLVPGRQVKVLARPTGGYEADPWTTLWIGRVDTVSAPWRTANTSNATLRCVDALARLSRIDPVKTPMPREGVNARLNRLFDMAGWTGGRNLYASTSHFARAKNADTNLLDEAQLTAYSASLFIYADRSNVLCTKPFAGAGTGQYQLTNNTVTFADSWCPLLPVDFPGASGQQVYNRIILDNAVDSGITPSFQDPPKTYENASSVTAYGVRPYSQTNLNGDIPITYVDQLGDALLAHYAWPRPGHLTYQIDLPSGIRNGSALNLAAVELQDTIYTDLTLDPVDGPPWTTTGKNKLHYIVGVEHSITDDTWTVSLNCDQYAGVEPAFLTTDPEQEQMAWH
jgi:hypothetical protein